MQEPANNPQPAPVPDTPVPLWQINQSCRAPVFLLLTSAAVWLVIASVLALIASIKFHSPSLLADNASLTYGRVRPAAFDSLLYGACLEAGMAVGLWLLARLGQRPLVGSMLALAGGIFWNIGVTIGICGVLAGDSTGFESFEMPGYALIFVFIGWLLMAVPAMLTFHYRKRFPVFPSQWFVMAALFWFPWIFTTAALLLISYPMRGVAQSVIAWWYAENLQEVCLGSLGLAAVFFIVPRLTGRPLYSRYLALLAFWVLLLFTSWGGIPSSAPVPAWIPAMSHNATLLTLLLLFCVGLNVYRTRWVARPVPVGGTPQTTAPPAVPHPKAGIGSPLSFMMFGVGCFLCAGLMRIGLDLLDQTEQLQFSWFTVARTELHLYGFFMLVMFGAAYHILPLIAGTELPWPKLVRVHFWIAVSGVLLIVLPLAIGGILQAVELSNPSVAFVKMMKSALHFLRVTTIGELLLLLGHGLFFANVAGVLSRFYRARVVPVYEAATEDLFKVAEGRA